VNARKLLPVVAVAVVACAIAGAALLVLGPRTADRLTAGHTDAKTQWHEGGTGASPEAAGPAPERVRIPAIGVDSALESLALDAEGALGAPKAYDHAGWYADGTRPGDVGPAVIAGHVDSHTGPAVFYRLHQLKQGDTIEVARSGGTTAKFRVLAVRKYPKKAFPTDEVYAPTPNAQLRLITCGGAFDQSSRSYVDNVVVYAVLV